MNQFIPVPEYLTALAACENEDGIQVAFDVAACGCTAMYSIDSKNETRGYIINNTEGEFDGFMTVKTMHCKECGQRMTVDDIPMPDKFNGIWECYPGYFSKRIAYRCNCGMCYTDEKGWYYSRGEQA